MPNLAYQGMLAEPESDAILDADPDALFEYMLHHDTSLLPKAHPLIASFKVDRCL